MPVSICSNPNRRGTQAPWLGCAGRRLIPYIPPRRAAGRPGGFPRVIDCGALRAAPCTSRWSVEAKLAPTGQPVHVDLFVCLLSVLFLSAFLPLPLPLSTASSACCLSFALSCLFCDLYLCPCNRSDCIHVLARVIRDKVRCETSASSSCGWLWLILSCESESGSLPSHPDCDCDV